MLTLLFWVDESRYAIDVRSVVEVIPRVELQQVHGTPEIVAGFLNYQGNLVPVIHLSRVLGNNDAEPMLSTRIILVSANPQDAEPQHLGLLAERVTETLDESEVTGTMASADLSASPYLSKLLLHQQEIIQCLNIQQLLPEHKYAQLLSQVDREVTVETSDE